ncbi:PP2C family protein-serine/threonine phosphatase [Streptomyces sp. NPDC005017]|uniref:PP2C family protein-serine/threonine phosphatase n=1 Tax=Streptomyces sp. NPDC005017 TaxID=3364706 RepID=UPI00367586BB
MAPGEERGAGARGRRVGPPPAERRRASWTRTFVRALPALLIGVGAVYDLLTPSVHTAAPFFTAAPLVAAPLYSRRGTLLTGLVALVVVVVVHVFLGIALEAESVTEEITVGTVAFLAVVINNLVRRSSERLASVREIAEAAQRAVLPQPPGRIGGFEIAARYEAAQRGAFIGGDLYAVQDTPHGVRLVVGDVRGKGMGAVSAVAVVIGAFREAAEQEAALETIAQRLERALERDVGRRLGPEAEEGFTTAVLAELPHGDGIVRLLHRGHPPPFVLHADGTLHTLEPRVAALPLGLGDLEPLPVQAEERPFPAGATLLLHTDGLSEARDADGVFYDPGARLAGRVFRGPEQLLQTLVGEVRRHTGGALGDDMALLAVRRPGAAARERA